MRDDLLPATSSVISNPAMRSRTNSSNSLLAYHMVRASGRDGEGISEPIDLRAESAVPPDRSA